MRITKCTARFDPATNDLVLEHLEMEDVHDGVLHLRPAFLERLLNLVPEKLLTLDEMVPEDLDENQVNSDAAYREVCEALKARHERLHRPGGMVCHAFCRCGYHDLDGNSDLCRRLEDLYAIKDETEWLKFARALRDEARDS